MKGVTMTLDEIKQKLQLIDKMSHDPEVARWFEGDLLWGFVEYAAHNGGDREELRYLAEEILKAYEEINEESAR